MVNEQERSAGEIPAFWDVVHGHMVRIGIESAEELHGRFVETEWAYIPTPGRHKGKPVSLEEFKRHVGGEYPLIYGELARGLFEILGITEDKEQGELVLSYVWGRPKMGVRPESPLEN